MKLGQRRPKDDLARSASLRQRGETFLREFEWTWTKAVVAALALWFFGIGFLAVIPSWWLYFAQQTLHWQPCPCPDALHFWLFKLRDLIAVMLFSIPFLLLILVPLILQKTRRRLRGQSEARPSGGYR